MNTKKKNYIEGLDAMRGIAILGVVFYHLIPGKFPGGFLGVNMFFVLSGYLIYKGAEWEVTNGKYSVQKFYMKRIKKNFPTINNYDMLGVWNVSDIYTGSVKRKNK